MSIKNQSNIFSIVKNLEKIALQELKESKTNIFNDIMSNDELYFGQIVSGLIFTPKCNEVYINGTVHHVLV